MKTLHFAAIAASLSFMVATSAWADAQSECEEWARNDNVSPMLWDRYVDSCVDSLNGEDIDESAPEDDNQPAGTPPTPEPPGVDLSY